METKEYSRDIFRQVPSLGMYNWEKDSPRELRMTMYIYSHNMHLREGAHMSTRGYTYKYPIE